MTKVAASRQRVIYNHSFRINVLLLYIQNKGVVLKTMKAIVSLFSATAANVHFMIWSDSKSGKLVSK